MAQEMKQAVHQTYPNLHALCGHNDNFPIVIHAMEKHFPDLFQLSALENSCQQHISQMGKEYSQSYRDFFKHCMSKLANRYTEGEIVEALSRLLNMDQQTKAYFSAKTLYVPHIGESKSKQIGFVEKLSVGDLSAAEPLMYVDMIRFVNFLELKSGGIDRKVRDGYKAANFVVCHMSHLQYLKNTPQKIAIVNFNANMKEMPKWGVVQMVEKGRALIAPRIYCEARLQEAEKTALNTALGIQVSEQDYIGGNAEWSASTGYTALAWLNRNTVQCSAMTLHADFTDLLCAFILTQQFVAKNEEKFFTSAYKKIYEERTGWMGPYGQHGYLQQHDHVLMNAFIFSGNNAYPDNDLCAAIAGIQESLENKAVFARRAAYGRSSVPGLDALLMRQRYLTVEETNVVLSVPERINASGLHEGYGEVCDNYMADQGLFAWVYRRESQDLDKRKEDLAIAMVLSTLRTRAKKQNLTITLPRKFSINPEEAALIFRLLTNNAFICTLNIINQHPGLLPIAQKLLPNFARNRWLHHNDYCPPMTDNYWQRAAEYWAFYLSRHRDILSPTKKNKLFHSCVKEMGLQGLTALLTLLADDSQAEFLEVIFPTNDQATFFLASMPDETEQCVDALIFHVNAGMRFPFNVLSVHMNKGFNEKYIRLFSAINKKSHAIEEITLIVDSLDDLLPFLQRLTKAVKNQKWTSLIVIPELENHAKALTEHHQALKNSYTFLNDLILRNRRLAAEEDLVKAIANDFGHLDEHEVIPNQVEEVKAVEGEPQDEKQDGSPLSNQGPWPLKRGGAVQLQLQQQQEIQQQRQMQVQQQKVQIREIDKPFTGELVSYHNIERLLKEKLEPGELEEEKEGEINPLQSFFSQCVSANPLVDAPHVIKYMTQEAASRLWEKRKRVPGSGLKPDNTSKGFYTQRAADKGLVLCYDPAIAYVRKPTPLTLDLTVESLKALPWEGDFRQFNIDLYMDAKCELLEGDLACLSLFAMMQPPRDHTIEINRFFRAFPKLVQIEINGFFGAFSKPVRDDSAVKEQIRSKWIIFKQCWEYAGETGFQFFRKEFIKKNYVLSLPEAYELLFEHQSAELRQWAMDSLRLDVPQLRALGQLYYRCGPVSVSQLLYKLQEVQLTLGQEFFEKFKTIILTKSENYADFFTKNWFSAINDMNTKLRGVGNNAKRLAWLSVAEKHFAVGWEKTEDLWKAFEFFSEKLAEMGLSLTGHEFDNVPPENMFIYMDRLLDCLMYIPEQDQKMLFLSTLPQMDCRHGGIFYAITKENFRFFDRDLRLTNFEEGSPTYMADMRALYEWPQEKAFLKIKRVLAADVRFDRQDYQAMSQAFFVADDKAKNNLVWLLTTQYDNALIALSELDTLDPIFKAKIATHLHHAYYELGSTPVISLAALKALSVSALPEGLDKYLTCFPDGTFLEAVNILHASNNFDALEKLYQLVDQVETDKHEDKEEDESQKTLREQAIKLSVLLGGCEKENLEKFLIATHHLIPVVRRELNVLIRQLLSVKYDISLTKGVNFSDPRYWLELLRCIEDMKASPMGTNDCRIQFLNALSRTGWAFKYSTAGAYRALDDRDKPEGLKFFTDHEARLWRFFQQHIAISTEAEGMGSAEALQPLIGFFKRLQLNPTYLNEIEPLLSSLETLPLDCYWTAEYFHQLLGALQSKDAESAFPISVLKSLLNEPVVQPRNINEMDEIFPQLLTNALENILTEKTYTRADQALLCKLLLREFASQANILKTMEIVEILKPEAYRDARKYAFEALVNCKNFQEMTNAFEHIRTFLTHKSQTQVVTDHWPQTSAYWLRAATENPRETALRSFIHALEISSERKTLIFHIVAWSTLRPGIKDADAYEDQLRRKGRKLVQRLSSLSESKLIDLANCYPDQPAPDAHNILRFIKQDKRGSAVAPDDGLEEKKDEEVPGADDAYWQTILADFSRHPYAEPRKDHGSLSITREADLARMLDETRLTKDGKTVPLTTEQAMRLTLTFVYLKQLEQGLVCIEGEKIAAMDRPTLAAILKRLCEQLKRSPDDYLLRTQVWALLFQAMGHTTRKYPHLAQQFSILCNDMLVGSNTRMLQLATGEGKSHYVAMRAALHAMLRKKVEICTAKASLAKRDVADYGAFFKYLGLNADYIDPKSTPEAYADSDIHYTTLGSLSLFLDEQSYQGAPIEIARTDRVMLFDEFDFIRYDEGLHTSYNYARPIGKTPKEMTWFYQALNKFYHAHHSELEKNFEITDQHLKHLVQILLEGAGAYEAQQLFVAKLSNDHLTLVQLIQSASEAWLLEQGVHFTVRDVDVEVGKEIYPMREIIPLTRDNQPMDKSTFSLRVHQLLATRLNTEAKTKGEAQNYHVRPESRIVSSQIAQTRISNLCESWEAYSATISPLQANQLGAESGTQVLHVPTNQQDLRQWSHPAFFDSENERLQAMLKDLMFYLRENKSVLFAAKNDKEVEKLKTYLNHILPPKYHGNLIFYTNDDARTAEQILKAKKDKENWQDGKKTTPICLIASGFGRGDNVDVDAVFLFDVTDSTDRLQKGGRTARNGQHGTVHQYYVTQAVIEEEERLWQARQQLLGLREGEEVLENKEKTPGNIFNHLLMLREEVRDLENRANTGYRQRVGEYTHWGMTFFAGLENIENRDALTNRLSIDVERIAKCWLDIASNKQLSVTDQLRRLEQVMQDMAKLFMVEFQEGSKNVKNFAFSMQEKMPEWENVAPQNNNKDVLDTNTAKICRLLIRLSDSPLNVEKIQKVMMQLNTLLKAEDQTWFIEFLARAEKATTSQALLNALELIFKQQTNLSEKRGALRNAVRLPSRNMSEALELLLHCLTPETKTKFLESYSEHTPEVQEAILSHLVRSVGLISEESRVRAVLPIFAWSKRLLAVENSRMWVDEYLDHLDELTAIDPEILGNAFGKLEPLSYPDFKVLWGLSTRYWPEGIGELQKAIPPQDFHQLSSWENWACGLTDEREKTAFLKNFCEVRYQLYEAGQGEAFNRLLTATNNGWRRHQDPLLLLWRHLAHYKDNLPRYVELMTSCMKQPGKSWFNNLSACFRLPQETLSMHHREIRKFLDDCASSEEQKNNDPRLNIKHKKIGLVYVLQGLVGRRQSVSTVYMQRLFRLNLNQEMLQVLLNYIVPDNCINAPSIAELNIRILNFVVDHGLHEQLTPMEMKLWIDQFMHASFVLAERNKQQKGADGLLATWDDLLGVCGIYLRQHNLLRPINERVSAFNQLLSETLLPPKAMSTQWMGKKRLQSLSLLSAHPEHARILLNDVVSVSDHCIDNLSLAQFNIKILDCVWKFELHEKLSPVEMEVWIKQLIRASSSLMQWRSSEEPDHPLVWQGLLQGCDTYLQERARSGLAIHARLATFNEFLSEIVEVRQQHMSPQYLADVCRLTFNDDMIKALLTYPLPARFTDLEIEQTNDLMLKFLKERRLYEQFRPEEMKRWLSSLLTNVSMLAAAGSGHQKNIHMVDSFLKSCVTYLNRNTLAQPDMQKRCVAYRELLTDITNKVALLISDHEGKSQEDKINALLEVCLSFDLAKDMAAERILFMQLLHQGVFVAEPFWSGRENDQLIEQAYKKYAHQQKQIVQSRTGILTDQQQAAVLKLSDELKAIGEISVRPAGDFFVVRGRHNRGDYWRNPWHQPPNKPFDHNKELRESIKNIVAEYRQSWLGPSPERLKRLDCLQRLLGVKSYPAILHAVHEEIRTIIQSDEQVRSWGGNRHLETLQKLHDVVLSHWVQDETALPTFIDYADQAKTEFGLSKRWLLTLLNDRSNKHDDAPAVGFFGRDSLASIHMVKTALEHFPEAVSSADLQALLATLETNIGKLPDNARVAANLLLQQGRALNLYLTHEESVYPLARQQGGPQEAPQEALAVP